MKFKTIFKYKINSNRVIISKHNPTFMGKIMAQLTHFMPL